MGKCTDGRRGRRPVSERVSDSQAGAVDAMVLVRWAPVAHMAKDANLPTPTLGCCRNLSMNRVRSSSAHALNTCTVAWTRRCKLYRMWAGHTCMREAHGCKMIYVGIALPCGVHEVQVQQIIRLELT